MRAKGVLILWGDAWLMFDWETRLDWCEAVVEREAG